VRTTLKRGIGRPYTNGEPPRRPGGAAAYAAPIGPQNRYQVWRRSRGRLAGKIVLWTVVTLFVAAGALGGGSWLYLEESVIAIRASDPEVKKAEQILDSPLPGEATTALVIGYDKRFGEAGAGDPGRADTLMLLRADPQTDSVSLLSFPRDLQAEIPACGGRPAAVDRINAAYAYCGPIGAVRTVRQLTGVPINYLLVVNFHAFKQIVNKVGGVYVDVDRRYFNDNSGYEQYATINLQPGYQRLTGGAALDFARFRHTDSDLHRIARQQAFVKAFKQQVSAEFSVLKLPGIINVIVDNLQVGRGGKKKLDSNEVFGYARFLYELPAGHFFQARIGGLEGTNELVAAPESIQTAVRDFLNPDLDAAERATSVAQGRKPEDAAPEPAQVTIEVLNGNGVDGSASEAAAELANREYQAASGGNAAANGRAESAGRPPNFDYFTTLVLYDPERAGAAQAGRAVADLFGHAELQAAKPGHGLDAMLRVIVGQTFTGDIAPAPTAPTPERQPPAIERAWDDVLPALRKARHRVDFPILVPTVRAAGTILDPEVPVRVYSVKRKGAIRIVFRNTYGSYWGVEETAWTDAPILSGENVTRRIGGRTYRLYYDGAKLHMVAFEENGTVYWVSNTLLDELSNETMLAIAKGLRPLAAVQ
jgi:LCP family protein required for cell wall assembly